MLRVLSKHIEDLNRYYFHIVVASVSLNSISANCKYVGCFKYDAFHKFYMQVIG